MTVGVIKACTEAPYLFARHHYLSRTLSLVLAELVHLSRDYLNSGLNRRDDQLNSRFDKSTLREEMRETRCRTDLKSSFRLLT
jgi:hypothetical protein